MQIISLVWILVTALMSQTVSPPPTARYISIENYAYTPAKMSVTAGTTITWKNLDDDPHTVTANDGSFNSKGLAQGDTWSHRFDKPGTYAYHCTVHPMMQATVIVKESH